MKSLEQKAKDILQSGRRNVFISFAYEDINEVNLLRGQSKNEQSDIEFNDRSVHEPYRSARAEYIRQRLTERINQCSTTVVYVTQNTAKSDWVKWEVDKSIELRKRVLVVHKGASAPRQMPEWVSQYKLKVVPWSSLSAEL